MMGEEGVRRDAELSEAWGRSGAGEWRSAISGQGVLAHASCTKRRVSKL